MPMVKLGAMYLGIALNSPVFSKWWRQYGVIRASGLKLTETSAHDLPRQIGDPRLLMDLH